MPHDMFGEVVRRSIVLGTRRGYTLPLSIATHAALIALVIVVPLAATRLLPLPSSRAFVIVLPSPPPTPEAPPPVPSELPRVMPDILPSRAPLVAPDSIAPEPPPVITARLGAAGLPSRPPGAFPIAPPPAAALPPATPVRVGGDIKAPRKIRDVVPVYPAIARAARVQGSVIVEAIIGTDGRVRGSRVLRSIPLLDQAALDAVREWQYTPPTLNGAPIEVIMTATVTFSLEATR